MTLQTNSTLQGGKYIIKKVLGQGGFGITYLAENTMLEGKVAIKEFFMKELCERDESTSHVTLGTSSNREMVERCRQKFLKEARTIFKLNHPNIVRILDVFEENGTAYYVMDYIEGESLADMVKHRGALPEAEALDYVKEVGDALMYIHDKKMNHLDIKPSNIMRREEDRRIMLIDFGVSKQYDLVTSEGTSTTPVGISRGYSPAEQYRQQGVQTFSPQSDVYALAATLFKLLTGVTPPEAMEVQDDGLPIEDLQARHISTSVIAAIQCAMKGRRERTQSVALFLADLNESKGEKEETILIKDNPVRNNLPQQPLIETISFMVYGVSFSMVKVEAGTFIMGATPEQQNPWDDEKPIHQVTLSDNYYMGVTEVTQALWKAVMGGNPSQFKGDNHPVESVSWKDCQAFINKLNIVTGKNFRLPTEAEWEYAARGGKYSRSFQYIGSNNLDNVSWYSGNSSSHTHEVATKQSNELGLYDMGGNVWEWCSDKYGPYNAFSQIDPVGEDYLSPFYIARGGSLYNMDRDCRSSNRHFFDPNYKFFFLGLRLALSE